MSSTSTPSPPPTSSARRSDRSRTVTSAPLRAKARAELNPTIDPPTITTRPFTPLPSPIYRSVAPRLGPLFRPSHHVLQTERPHACGKYLRLAPLLSDVTWKHLSMDLNDRVGSSERMIVKRQIPRPRELAPLLRLRAPHLNTRSRRLESALTIWDLRNIAKQRTPKGPFDYTDGAAEAEISLSRARQAFEDIEFNPNILCAVTTVNTSSIVLGGPTSLPFGI